MSELRLALEQIVRSAVYRQWAAGSAVDASKVANEMRGVRRPLPSSAFARGLVRIARITVPAPPPPPPPPPPPRKVAPRTYNKVLPDGSDARYCITGLEKRDGLWRDDYSGYDDNGLDVVGGRTKDTQVPGLNQANAMDGRGPCDPYGPFPPWPDRSYDR